MKKLSVFLMGIFALAMINHRKTKNHARINEKRFLTNKTKCVPKMRVCVKHPHF